MVSRASEPAGQVLRPRPRPASTSARLVMDFEPGMLTVASEVVIALRRRPRLHGLPFGCCGIGADNGSRGRHRTVEFRRPPRRRPPIAAKVPMNIGAVLTVGPGAGEVVRPCAGGLQDQAVSAAAAAPVRRRSTAVVDDPAFDVAAHVRRLETDDVMEAAARLVNAVAEGPPAGTLRWVEGSAGTGGSQSC